MSTVWFVIWEIAYATLAAYVCFSWLMNLLVPWNQQKTFDGKSLFILALFGFFLLINVAGLMYGHRFVNGFVAEWWHYLTVFGAFFAWFFLNLIFVPYL